MDRIIFLLDILFLLDKQAGQDGYITDDQIIDILTNGESGYGTIIIRRKIKGRTLIN